MAREFVKVLRKKYQQLLKQGKLRYDTCCCKCGRSSEEVIQLELHHIVSLNQCPPERDFNPNVQSNLITLCFDCHLAYHRCFEESFPEEKIVDWLNNVSMDEVNSKLTQYRKEREERRRFHIEKHRQSNKPSGRSSD